MKIAYDVLVVYAAIAIWLGLLVRAWRTKSFRAFLGFGLLIAVALNIRYLIEGSDAGISYFVSIYDTFDNIGLTRGEELPAAMATCVDNECSVLGDRYESHQSWGVAFYDRFANGPALRNTVLKFHIGCNTAALPLMHWQLKRSGTSQPSRHRLIGRITFGLLTVGTIAALWMASEHGDVEEYGGILSTLGFMSMSVFVYGTAIAGIVTARRGDYLAHRVWMFRCLGSMWGAFWLFRVMLIFTGPLLRNWESASLLISIWFSAPLGILIAEWYRRRSLRPAEPVATIEPASLVG